MKKLFEEISSIAGVAEICVFNRSRGAIYSDVGSSSILNGEVLQTVALHFVRLFQMGGTADLKISSSQFYFSKYVVIGVSIDLMTVTLIICESHVNCSAVTETIDMMTAAIRDKIPQRKH